MTPIKLVLVIALTSIFSQVSIAQKTPQDRAKANMESLNQKIIAKNKDAALTEDQKAKLMVLFLEQAKAIDVVREQYTDPEERKAKNQEVYKRQSPKTNSVLTEEQRLALKKE
jgi:hypothetical protein